MSSISYREREDGSVWYNLVTGCITTYEDYLVIDQGILTRNETQLYYSDIISVSASDGGLFFGNSFIQLNTAGRSYSLSALTNVKGFCYVKEQIEKKMAESKNKPKPNTQVISTADEIAKYKELANQGVITQEEFEAKKKQLLNL